MMLPKQCVIFYWLNNIFIPRSADLVTILIFKKDLVTTNKLINFGPYGQKYENYESDVVILNIMLC